MTSGSNLEQQVLIVLRALEGRKYEGKNAVYETAVKWMGQWPEEVDVALKDRLLRAICVAFSVPSSEVFNTLVGGSNGTNGQASYVVINSEDEMLAALPQVGFLKDYANYTLAIEAPMSFHVFAAVSMMGCVIGRKCWVDMRGVFKIYGANGVLLIGPTGKVKKSTAIDVARGILLETATCPVMSDMITPQALDAALFESSYQFLCASEFSNFLGRQKYNEGLITKILRLMDFPDTYEVRTLSHGAQLIEKPALTILGGSTMSLLNSSAPGEVMSGGFLNRFLPVIEQASDRCFPMPEFGAQRQCILDCVRRVREHKGPLELSVAAFQVYESWYKERWKYIQHTDDKIAEVSQRLPTHALRVAMIQHLAQCDDHMICRDCFESAIKLVSYVDKKLPALARSIERSVISQDADYVLEMLSKLGGASDHSNLLRRVSSRMNAPRFKVQIETLQQSGRIKVTKRGSANIYTINKEETGE